MPTHLDAMGKELTPQEQAFVRLVATEGYSIKDASAHREVGIATVTGHTWMKRERIRLAMQEVLAETRQLNRRMARARVHKAWATVDNALTNPAVTPTMLKAAALVLMHANGDEKYANDAPVIHVEVNTQLNNNVLAEQQQRHSQQGAVYEGGFEVIEDEGQV